MPDLHLIAQCEIQQPGDSGGHLLWRRPKPGFYVIGAQHQGQDVNRPMTAQSDFQTRPRIHMRAHHQVLVLRGAAGQPLFDQIPPCPKRLVRDAGPAGLAVKPRIDPPCHNRWGAVGVAVTET